MTQQQFPGMEDQGYRAPEPYGGDFKISHETRGKINRLKQLKSEIRSNTYDTALEEFLYSLDADLEKHLGKPSSRESYLPYIYPSKRPS